MKKICILGAGHMGTWFTGELSHEYDVAVYDQNQEKIKDFSAALKLSSLEAVKDFAPDLLINAVSLHLTISVFESVLPFLDENCIISDITSVKSGLLDFYKNSGFKFVSTHPMFGPTFANIENLKNENAIIISESCEEGIEFFRKFYSSFNLDIHDYSFEDHDKTTAYSLSTPFISSIVFAAVMKKQHAPGTTYKKHMQIAKGLMSEDDYLISEILFNPNTLDQVEKINQRLSYLTHIIKGRDYDEMIKFLTKLRENIKD